MEKLSLDQLKEKVGYINQEDSFSLLQNAARLEKIIQRQDLCFDTTVRIGVIGSYSLQLFVKVLRVMLLKNNILCEIFEGDFNSIEADILNSKSLLYDFKPDIVIILSDYTDIRTFPALMASREEVDEWGKNQIDYYRHLWRSLNDTISGVILQSNFVIPMERELGNLETNYYYSKTSCLRLVNSLMTLKHPNYVKIVDMDYIASSVGKIKWFDYSSYFLYKTGFNSLYLNEAVKIFQQLILASKGMVKKCLVLDLDNTLWGGVIGDDGEEGIILEPNNPEGEAFRAFQQYVLSLKNRGILLAICSKNEMDIAMEPFLKNEFMILKMEDISCFKANWNDKVSNIKNISLELNIGLESFVFFDDNPAERDLVKKFLPMVQVITVPEDPAEYVSALNKAYPFEWLQITKEDLNRSQSYYENIKRIELEQQFGSYEDYLDSLEMQVDIGIADIKNVERMVQLINKTNQFNLRTIRYSEQEISSLLENKNYTLLYVSLKDKFSVYGIIACVILNFEALTCFIDTWVMSCRVLNRGIEKSILNQIVEMAKNRGALKIVGEYIPTKKNKPVKDLYKLLGFSSDKQEAADGVERYSIEIK